MDFNLSSLCFICRLSSHCASLPFLYYIFTSQFYWIMSKQLIQNTLLFNKKNVAIVISVGWLIGYWFGVKRKSILCIPNSYHWTGDPHSTAADESRPLERSGLSGASAILESHCISNRTVRSVIFVHSSSLGNRPLDACGHRFLSHNSIDHCSV